jgi:hypothetical protein
MSDTGEISGSFHKEEEKMNNYVSEKDIDSPRGRGRGRGWGGQNTVGP